MFFAKLFKDIRVLGRGQLDRFDTRIDELISELHDKNLELDVLKIIQFQHGIIGNRKKMNQTFLVQSDAVG